MRNTRNWKHATKKEKQYGYFTDADGNIQTNSSKKSRRVFGKRNTPFMNEDFDEELLLGA